MVDQERTERLGFLGEDAARAGGTCARSGQEGSRASPTPANDGRQHSLFGRSDLVDVRIPGIPHHPRRSQNTNDWVTGHHETATRIRVSALGRAAPHAVQKDAVRLTTVERSGLALLHMFAPSRAAVVASATGAIQTARAMAR